MEGGPIAQEQEGETNSTENEEEAGCCNFFCHPRRGGYRFIALIFMCFLGFGSYFCYDTPAALQNYIEKDINITLPQYTMLYSIYSWPNVIFCFIGGFLIDRVFGIRLGTNLYMGLTLVGQLAYALGAYSNQYWLMLVGRFIFGIGGESLAVAQNNYAVLWFKGKELNMVFGLQLSFARVGSTVNFLVMDHLYQWVHQKYTGPEGLGIVLFIATSTCILSMFCALILGSMDKRAERILRRNDHATGDVARLTDVKDFKATFWWLTVICVSYYGSIFPFITLAKAFFMNKFHMSDQEANSISGSIYFVSGIASPLLGWVIDKTGKNLSWIISAVCITIGTHALLAFTMVSPYVGMIIMGLAYSALASSLWPLVSLVIPEYQLGTAYGVCQAIQNLGLAVYPMITGAILDRWNYTVLEIFFIASLAVALLSTIVLWVLDMVRKGSLNMTTKNRLTYEHNILAANILETERLLAASAADASNEFPQANSDFHIRNRYLSRIGAPLPPSYNVTIREL